VGCDAELHYSDVPKHQLGATGEEENLRD
jgi:hypothetical protein